MIVDARTYTVDLAPGDRLCIYSDGVPEALNNDLESFALADLDEMEFVGSTTDVNVVVQIDRSELYDTSNGNWTDARRFYVTHDTALNQHHLSPTDIQGIA